MIGFDNTRKLLQSPPTEFSKIDADSDGDQSPLMQRGPRGLDMDQSSGYGEEFGERLRARATSFVSRALNHTNIAVTELRSDNPEHGVSSPLRREDAYLVGYHFVDYPVHEYFEDDRAAPVTSLRVGQTTLYDLKRSPQFTINKACHCVHFYFPRSALNNIADSAEAKPINELQYDPGVGVDDPVMSSLASVLAPAFDNPARASRLFVDHVTFAVGVHIAKTYGGMIAKAAASRGGLAKWQQKRAEEMLAANLTGDVSLADLASDCGLSSSHFARAFRASTGVSPHQWLLRHRVQEAQRLLANDEIPLAEIALTCGFGDQSHFTRVFSRMVGLSPGAWRRAIG
jgi:AraC-like DNA-binding protein